MAEMVAVTISVSRSLTLQVMCSTLGQSPATSWMGSQMPEVGNAGPQSQEKEA